VSCNLARILIADDEEEVRGLIVRALAQDGHEVAGARDGAEALDILCQPRSFDLLLADIRMPVMDGIALALAAARDHPDLSILLMTAYADQRERASGLERLLHGVISKPFNLDTLRTAVNGALSARAQKARGG
jgi:two-component system cell cycle response regulator CpdR